MTARGGRPRAIHAGGARLHWPAGRGHSVRMRRVATHAVIWRTPPALGGAPCRFPKEGARLLWTASPSENRENQFHARTGAAPADRCEERVNRLLELCRRR